MRDTIYRDDAIKAIKDHSFALGDDYMEINGYGAIDDIRALPSADRWIPCSERLPELTIHENEPFIGEWDNSEPVLIYHRDNEYQYPYLIAQYTNGFVNGKVGWTEMEGANEVINVLAWMPLPEPWKGADDE